MKTKIHALLFAAGCLAMPQAQAGWFDWFTPGEWVDGVDAEGLYTGAAMNVVKTTGQLNRRLGGENDFGQGNTLLIKEPGLITTAFLRGGWKPIDFLAIEAQYGVPLDTDRIDNDSNSQQFKMDSLYGIYLKPQFTFGDMITLFGRAGYTDFSFTTRCYSTYSNPGDGSGPDRTVPTGCRDTNGVTMQDANGNNVTSKKFADSGFSWSGGIQLKLSTSTRLAFEYTQHFDDDDAEVIAVGVGMTYLFGQSADEDDDYYYY